MPLFIFLQYDKKNQNMIKIPTYGLGARRRREKNFRQISQVQIFFGKYKKLILGIFEKKNSDISDIGGGVSKSDIN